MLAPRSRLYLHASSLLLLALALSACSGDASPTDTPESSNVASPVALDDAAPAHDEDADEDVTDDADDAEKDDAELSETEDEDDANDDEARANLAALATKVVTVEQASGRVMVFDFKVTDWSKESAVVRTWTPPAGFSNLSDVKYSKDGKRFLVASSGGGIAVVRASDQKILLQAAPGGNTHAIDELPDGSVVSASSTGGFLKLYSKRGELRQTISFTDAHGVYWDRKRRRLYADGGPVVRAFRYRHGKLKDSGSWSLPNGESGAHDLFPIPRSNELYVSNGSHVYQFNRLTHAFGPYTSGPDRSAIKSVGRNPGSNIVCLMKATNAPGPVPRSWSSDTIIFDQPGAAPATVTRVRPGAQFYKARWAAPTP